MILGKSSPIIYSIDPYKDLWSSLCCVPIPDQSLSPGGGVPYLAKPMPCAHLSMGGEETGPLVDYSIRITWGEDEALPKDVQSE